MNLDRIRSGGREENEFGATGPLNIELVNELNERVEILMSENALLVEQKAVLTAELDDCINELESRTEECTNFQEENSKIKENIQKLKLQLSQVEFDRNESATKTIDINQKLSSLYSDHEQLKIQLKEIIEKYETCQDDLQSAQSQIKSLITKNDEEGHTAMQRIKSCEDRVRELHMQLLQKTQEVDSVNEISRKLKREYQSTRQDAEGMLQVITHKVII